MTIGQFIEIFQELHYPGWEFRMRVEDGFFLLWVQFEDEEGQPWSGRKWYISPHSTESEIVQTALKAVLTAEEHEAREKFRYRGRVVLGPHIDVNALLEVADQLDARHPHGAEVAG